MRRQQKLNSHHCQKRNVQVDLDEAAIVMTHAKVTEAADTDFVTGADADVAEAAGAGAAKGVDAEVM